jgi:hypothetical protein
VSGLGRLILIFGIAAAFLSCGVLHLLSRRKALRSSQTLAKPNGGISI